MPFSEKSPENTDARLTNTLQCCLLTRRKLSDKENTDTIAGTGDETFTVELESYSITWIAPDGHWHSHALQTKHSSTLTGEDLLSLISKTPTGHVFTQVSHPSHFAVSTTIFTILIPLLFLIENQTVK